MFDILTVNQLSDIPNRVPTLVAIGSFDGVHLGHQAVLRSMVAQAQQLQMRTAVLTFFPHPQRVLRNLNGPYYISTLADRVKWLADCGVDVVITHPFNEEVRHTRAAIFVDQLCTYLDMRQLWGGNFALGYQREGDVPFLRALGKEKGYTVELVDELVMWQGERVSSSRIRRHLEAGEINEANGCLGRPYRLRGMVVKGDQRGRTIGFPTANIAFWHEQVIPENGVYAATAWVGQTSYRAATNVGVRPTVDGSHLTVEAHLLDFNGDLYDKELCLEFHARIRPEKKFSGLEELKAQINADVAQVRAIL